MDVILLPVPKVYMIVAAEVLHTGLLGGEDSNNLRLEAPPLLLSAPRTFSHADAGGDGQLRDIRDPRFRRHESPPWADGARAFRPRRSRAGRAPNRPKPVCYCRGRPHGSGLEQRTLENGKREPEARKCSSIQPCTHPKASVAVSVVDIRRVCLYHDHVSTIAKHSHIKIIDQTIIPPSTNGSCQHGRAVSVITLQRDASRTPF